MLRVQKQAVDCLKFRVTAERRRYDPKDES